MFSRIRTAVCYGIEGRGVYAETDVARGLPGINIVGLASTMVMESRERIKSAIINSGLEYPRSRITVNLTPASLRKNGSGLDLPIAVGILSSNMYIDAEKAGEYGIVGELALDGKVLGVKGVLPMILALQKAGTERIIIPYENRLEASLTRGVKIYPVRDLAECLEIINRGEEPAYEEGSNAALIFGSSEPEWEGSLSEGSALLHEELEPTSGAGDFMDISGQETAKRAILIAVTGRHGILMIGSPGCGKTMLASRIPSIMPPMTRNERIETAIIYSAAGKSSVDQAPVITRPFRHPHHTIGRAGLIGGGSIPVPGEISLAHNGVLFLDEACEFEQSKIEALRLPMEERIITHFRKGESYTFPCSFQLVMASNPCPCGYFGDPDRICSCTEAQLARYSKKLSGPIMDRIDMRITMEKVTYDELRTDCRGLSSAEMRRIVEGGIDFARRMGRSGSNALMTDYEIEEHCRLGREEEAFLSTAYEALKLSPRSYKKTLKVARTIADLDASPEIRQRHIAEALSYRITEKVNE